MGILSRGDLALKQIFRINYDLFKNKDKPVGGKKTTSVCRQCSYDIQTHFCCTIYIAKIGTGKGGLWRE